MTPYVSLLAAIALPVGTYFAVKLLRPFFQTLATARQKSTVETELKQTAEQGQALQTDIDKLAALDT